MLCLEWNAEGKSLMMLTIHPDCREQVKALLLPWPGTVVGAPQKCGSSSLGLHSFQTKLICLFSPDFKKKEYRNTKEGKNISFGCSVSPDENWVIKEQLFLPLYLITKRNQSLKIKLQVPELY